MTEIIIDVEKLKEPAKPLAFLTDQGPKTEAGQEIIDKLKEVLDANEDLNALAAPQIGIDKRIFCIRFNNVIKTFINPVITKKTGSSVAPETFGSMPGKEIVISRPDEVTVIYYNDDFKYEENKLLGGAARVFDQMAQVLDGVTPDELGLVSDVATDGSVSDLSEEDYKQVIEIYNQFITAKAKALEEALSNDDEVANHYRRLKATEQIINGRITIVEPEEESLERAKLNRMAKTAENKQKAVKQKAERKAYVNDILKRKKR